METFSGLAMRALDDEALGWFSRRLPWGSYGLLCHASLCAPSLGVALARWCRHHALLTLGEARLVLGSARRRGSPVVPRGSRLRRLPRVLRRDAPARAARLRLLGHRFTHPAAGVVVPVPGTAAPRRTTR
jgi:hypothetical protein